MTGMLSMICQAIRPPRSHARTAPITRRKALVSACPEIVRACRKRQCCTRSSPERASRCRVGDGDRTCPTCCSTERRDLTCALRCRASDTDDEGEEQEEYDRWKIRELKRIKRDKEEREVSCNWQRAACGMHQARLAMSARSVRSGALAAAALRLR